RGAEAVELDALDEVGGVRGPVRVADVVRLEELDCQRDGGALARYNRLDRETVTGCERGAECERLQAVEVEGAGGVAVGGFCPEQELAQGRVLPVGGLLFAESEGLVVDLRLYRQSGADNVC